MARNLLLIIHVDNKGDEHILGVTDNFDKWLEENNAGREVPETIDDFKIRNVPFMEYDYSFYL